VRRYLTTYGFAAALAFLYLYSFPYFDKIRHANELPRVYLTRAMVDEGRFAIDTGVERWGTTADVSPHAGHHYSNKAPGASMLAAPAYGLVRVVRSLFGMEPPGLAETTWLCRVVTGVIPTLLFLLLLYRFLARWAPRPETRRLVIGAYALGSMAMPYSILYHSHQLSAVVIATAFILSVRVFEDRRDSRWMWLAGLAAGCAPLVDYQAAFAGVPIAVYVIWRAVQQRRWRPVANAAAGSVPPIALLLYYHAACFGGPLQTGYGASETFAHHHQKGFLGMDQLRLEALTGSTVAADHGLLFFCPVLLAALVGWYLLARRRAWWVFGVTFAIAVIFIAFQSSINFWRAGWSLGPRYITAALPFLFVPVAVAADAADDRAGRWPLRGLLGGLALVGIAVYALSCAEYPHFPEKFANPLYEVTFALIGDGRAPYNLGYAVGLRGLASLVPYLLVLAAVVGYLLVPVRDRWKSGALAVAVAGAILAAYSAAPRGDPAQTFRAYHCYVAGVMPDRPADGRAGGRCVGRRGCEDGTTCLVCDPSQRLCVEQP
jgi:hypothetical protein